MKIKISIERVYDTADDDLDLFPTDSDPIKYALHYFAEDIDYLVKYNQVTEQADVSVLPDTIQL